MNLKKFVPRLSKRLVVILIIIILAIGVPFYLNQRKSIPTPQLISVQKQDIKSTVSVSGNLDGQASVDLRFKNPGKLSYLNVKNGSLVTQNQIIAGLDTQDLSITLQQAQNNLRSSQATVDKILDDIHLFQYGNGGFANVGTASETQTQRQLRMNSEAARDNAFDSVRAAKQAFQDTVITSPISGVVVGANLKPGQFVSPNDVVAHVVDFSQYLFAADVDEADISKISLGQNAEVTLDAYGDQVFTGQVVEIVAQTKTSISGGTTVTVKIALNHPDIKQIQGLGGQANIILTEKNNTLVVPQEAVINDKSVIVKTPRGLKLTNITEGIKSDTEVEITSGLKEGEVIVSNPSSQLVASLNRGQ